MYRQAPLLRWAGRGTAAAQPDAFIERDIVSHDGANGRGFADAGNHKITGMKRRDWLAVFDVAEVMQTDHIVFRGRFVDDGLGPDTMLVESPGYGQPAGAVYALVVYRHAALLGTRRRGFSRRALPLRRIASGSHDDRWLHLSADDDPVLQIGR